MYEMPIKIWNNGPSENPADTKSVEAETYLIQSCLNPILQSIDEGVVGIRSDGNIDQFNPIAERLTGYSREEAIGQSVFQILQFSNQKSSSLFTTTMNALLNNQDINGPSMSCTIISLHNHHHNIEIQYLPYNDQTGRLILIRDLSEKQDLEQKMLQLGHLESIGLLAGGIAHDFNNLLIGILGNIDLAKTIPSNLDALGQCLTEAEKATLRAKHLTKQLLTLSKGGAPDKKLTVLGEDLVEAATFALHGTNVQCKWNLSSNLWPAEVDAGQIGQVIQNLIINAEQAMINGGLITVICENIHLTSASDLSDGPYIKITVADQGTGIPKEHIEHVFDPYFTTKENGSGLGLATSYAIIKRHDGTMFLETVPDEGTTFTIFLPASSQPVPHVESVDTDDMPDSCTGKILILDDETVIQDLIGRMLNNAGYEVDFADDGRSAIETYKAALDRHEPFDVVIMDLTIPGGMGGKDTIQELLIYDPNIKGIVSSGYPNDPVMEDCRSYGFKDSISKPYKFKELQRTLQDVILEK